MYVGGLLVSIEFSIGRNGKGLAAGPLYGAAALSIAMPNFFVGNTVHILESFHPLEVIKAIDSEKVTTTFLAPPMLKDRKSTRLNSSHVAISYAVFCLKKKKRTCHAR